MDRIIDKIKVKYNRLSSRQKIFGIGLFFVAIVTSACLNIKHFHAKNNLTGNLATYPVLGGIIESGLNRMPPRQFREAAEAFILTDNLADEGISIQTQINAGASEGQAPSASAPEENGIFPPPGQEDKLLPREHWKNLPPEKQKILEERYGKSPGQQDHDPQQGPADPGQPPVQGAPGMPEPEAPSCSGGKAGNASPSCQNQDGLDAQTPENPNDIKLSFL
jgi:hypothetical protein